MLALAASKIYLDPVHTPAEEFSYKMRKYMYSKYSQFMAVFWIREISRLQ